MRGVLSLKTLLVAGLLVTVYLAALMALRLLWGAWRQFCARRQTTDDASGDLAAGSVERDVTEAAEQLRREARRGIAVAVLWIWLANTVLVWSFANVSGRLWPEWTMVAAIVVALAGTLLVRRRLAAGRVGPVPRRPRSGLHVMSVSQGVLDGVFHFAAFTLTLAVLVLVGGLMVTYVVGGAGQDATAWDLVERTLEMGFGDPASVFIVLVVFTSSVILLALARRWGRSFRGAALPPATDLMDRDATPPILLLRAFDHDRVPVLASSPWRRPLIDVVWPTTADELESVLARIASRYGPPIAISLPSAQHGRGALRDRSPTDNWLPHVLDRARAARLVVAVVGDSPGLRTELEAIGARPELRRKSIVLLPPGEPQIDEQALRALNVPSLATSAGRLIGFADGQRFEGERIDESSYAAVVQAMIDSTSDTWRLGDNGPEPIRTGVAVGYDHTSFPSWMPHWLVELQLAVPVQVFIDGERRGEFSRRAPLELAIEPGTYDVQIQAREIFRRGLRRWARPISEPKRIRSGELRSDARIVVHSGSVTRVLVGWDQQPVRVFDDQSQ